MAFQFLKPAGFMLLFSGMGWAQTRPNLIFILADDMGYGEAAPFGQQILQTPSLDKMAQEGMRLTSFYTGTPVCAPSRCNLMTGMHNGHCRIRDNDVDYLRPQDITLAEVLKYAGYRTGLFGKWGLSFNNQPGSFPTRQGFDRFFGYLDQRHAHNFYPTFLINDEDSIPLRNVVPNQGAYGDGNASVEVDYSHDLIADSALKFIDDSKDTTFFMYVAFTTPHINNEGAGGADGGFEVPDLGPYAAMPWTRPKASYGSMITRMDRDIGRILARLNVHGIDNRTCIVFTSDNGATYLRNGTDTAGAWFDGNGPFRGYKSDIFEGGIHMPALVRWPGLVPPGSASNVSGYFPDIMPTFAEFAGVSVPSNIDGVSLAPTWLGRSGQRSRQFLYWFYPFRTQRAVRLAGTPWKSVWVNGVQALYNLDVDSLELNDVKAANPNILRIMDSINTAQGTGQPVVGNWVPSLLPPVVSARPESPRAPGLDFDFRDGTLALRGLSETPRKIRLVGWNGRTVWEKTPSSVNFHFSLEEIQAGLYFFSVQLKYGEQFQARVILLPGEHRAISGGP